MKKEKRLLDDVRDVMRLIKMFPIYPKPGPNAIAFLYKQVLGMDVFDDGDAMGADRP